MRNIDPTNKYDKESLEPYSTLSIGALLFDAGKITTQNAEAIIRLQKEKGLRFGDAALQLGLVKESDIQKVLSQQFDFPYIPATDDVVSQEIIAAYQPFSKQVEALRAVRSQLILRWFNSDRKLLSVVSTARNEGRSYICANLAVIFSQLGEKTLLIDANLRQPKQHVLFKLQQKQGLSDLLAGRVDSRVIFKSPQFRDLSILPAGTIAPNPVELISRGLNIRLQKFSQEYDVIIIDTPATQVGTEAQIISSNCGGYLLVARQNQSRLKDLEEMKSDFEESSIQCLGAVINDF